MNQLKNEFTNILNFIADNSNVKIIEVNCDISETHAIENKINQEIKNHGMSLLEKLILCCLRMQPL